MPIKEKQLVKYNIFLKITIPSNKKECFENILETPQSTEDNQVEILKAAKSLFSKRTRTLYHWMYPNTSKQQIKLAVASSWENLELQEKQFYISQVFIDNNFYYCFDLRFLGSSSFWFSSR